MLKNYISCEKRVMAEIQPWGITNYTECNDYHMPNVHSSGKKIAKFSTKENLKNGPKFSSYFVKLLSCVYTRAQHPC